MEEPRMVASCTEKRPSAVPLGPSILCAFVAWAVKPVRDVSCLGRSGRGSGGWRVYLMASGTGILVLRMRWIQMTLTGEMLTRSSWLTGIGWLGWTERVVGML